MRGQRLTLGLAVVASLTAGSASAPARRVPPHLPTGERAVAITLAPPGAVLLAEPTTPILLSATIPLAARYHDADGIAGELWFTVAGVDGLPIVRDRICQCTMRAVAARPDMVVRTSVRVSQIDEFNAYEITVRAATHGVIGAPTRPTEVFVDVGGDVSSNLDLVNADVEDSHVTFNAAIVRLAVQLKADAVSDTIAADLGDADAGAYTDAAGIVHEQIREIASLTPTPLDARVIADLRTAGLGVGPGRVNAVVDSRAYSLVELNHVQDTIDASPDGRRLEWAGKITTEIDITHDAVAYQRAVAGWTRSDQAALARALAAARRPVAAIAPGRRAPPYVRDGGPILAYPSGM